MSITVGMRDLARNSNILDGHDYVEVEDKKTHEYKGLFISPKYAKEFKDFLEEKISRQQQEKLDRIDKYTGTGEIYSRFNQLTTDQIKEQKAKEQYAKK